MEPIVNGLETEFDDGVVFEQLDARSERGHAAMSAYSFRGHPSYEVLDSDGVASWQFSGPVDEHLLRSTLVLWSPRRKW